ncbi:MAG: rod shape-determining protein MreD [Bacteroidia bacterium]|nr:rod shape-determining protein MreD [Bacteroidia bacterium]MCO5253795.1 rod shape-determining protein MreD [Bacteroidota bacterium]MCZ2131083.1 rod shape-determining protein MreD [Bacteroidia bacterium]
MKDWQKYILMFIYCFGVQIVILENIHVAYWFHPFVYLFFLLYFPPVMPKWLSVLVFFMVGLLYDVFLNSYGIHASACLLLGLIKPFVTIGNVNTAPTREDEKGSWLNKGKRRFKTIFLLSFILIHHFWVFFLESLGHDFITVFVPTWLGSTILTYLFLLLSEELFFRTFRTSK